MTQAPPGDAPVVGANPHETAPWLPLFTRPGWTSAAMWGLSLLGAVLVATLSWSRDAPTPVVLGAVLLPALSLIDLAVYRLPDPLVAASAGLCLSAGLGWAADSGDWATLAAAVCTGVGAGAMYAVLWFLVPPGAFGLGDVKLAVVCGFLLATSGGPLDVVAGLVVLPAILGVVLALTLGAFRPAVPFGPALAAGTLLCIWFPDHTAGLLLG